MDEIDRTIRCAIWYDPSILIHRSIDPDPSFRSADPDPPILIRRS
jgi:hypothetical protein